MWQFYPACVHYRALGLTVLNVPRELYILHLLHEFVDETSLEHVESTASMPSINLQRCAPAATALSYASLSNGHPHRAAASGSLSSSAVPMLWERLTTVFALAGPLPAAT